MKYSGVDPTGLLLKQINSPLYSQSETKDFKLLLFGDTQPYNMEQIKWIAHDVVEELIDTDDILEISLEDLVGDNLSLF